MNLVINIVLVMILFGCQMQPTTILNFTSKNDYVLINGPHKLVIDKIWQQQIYSKKGSDFQAIFYSKFMGVPLEFDSITNDGQSLFAFKEVENFNMHKTVQLTTKGIDWQLNFKNLEKSRLFFIQNFVKFLGSNIIVRTVDNNIEVFSNGNKALMFAKQGISINKDVQGHYFVFFEKKIVLRHQERSKLRLVYSIF